MEGVKSRASSANFQAVPHEETKEETKISISSPHLTASQIILQSIEEGPEEVVDSLFSRIFCGIRFGRFMQSTAIVICALALVFFLYLIISPIAVPSLQLRTIGCLLGGFVVLASARWAYDEHEILQYANFKHEMTLLQNQVNRLAPELDNLDVENKRLGSEVGTLDVENKRLGSEVGTLDGENKNYQRLNGELQGKLVDMESSNKQHQNLNAELQAKVAKMESANREEEELNGVLGKQLGNMGNTIASEKSENERLTKSNLQYASQNEQQRADLEKFKAFLGQLGKIAADFQSSNQGFKLDGQEIHQSADELQALVKTFGLIKDKVLDVLHGMQEQAATQASLNGTMSQQVQKFTVENTNLTHINDSLTRAVKSLAQGNDAQTIIQKVGEELLEKQKELTKQLQEIQEKEAAMLEVQARLQHQFEEENQEQSHITGQLKTLTQNLQGGSRWPRAIDYAATSSTPPRSQGMGDAALAEMGARGLRLRGNHQRNNTPLTIEEIPSEPSTPAAEGLETPTLKKQASADGKNDEVSC